MPQTQEVIMLETDQIDTASVRHRLPLVFAVAAVLAGIGLVLINAFIRTAD
jgi:hypothetical protein